MGTMTKQQTKTTRWNFDHLIGLDRDQKAVFQLISSGRMHPVILLEGRQGLGKRHLAVWIAARLLCEQGLGQCDQFRPCGFCGSCKEVLSGVHRDLTILDENGGPIRTADAEVFQEHFGVLSSSGLRIGIIMNADKMTMEAANRLLKTLEEPPHQAIIILTSSRPLSLPPTVLGRCLRWRVHSPDRVNVIKWAETLLKESGYSDVGKDDLLKFVQRLGFSPGRIYRAIEQKESVGDGMADDVRRLLNASRPSNVLQIAAHLARTKKAKLVDILDCAELELSAMYRENMTSGTSDAKNKMELAVSRRGLREALSSARRHAVIEKISLNSQLVMESMGLSRWRDGIL